MQAIIKNIISSFPPITHLLLAATLLLHINAAQISNYSTTSFIIKLVSLIILISCFIVYRSSNYSPRFALRPLLYALMTLIAFLLIPALTLIYSANPEFGILKLANFFISTVPVVVVLALLSRINDPEIWSAFIWVIGISILFLFLFALASNPFDQSTIYEFEAGRWSHVLVGRYAAITLILFTLVFLYSNSKWNIILPGILATISLLLLLSTGLRSAIIGAAIFIPVMFIISIIKGKVIWLRFSRLKFSGLKSLFFILLVIVAGVYFIADESTGSRIEKLTELTEGGSVSDPSLQVRKTLLEISIDIIKENPVIGIGLGGFKNYKGSKFLDEQKYPHNIILETLTEFGIIGLLLLFFLLYKIFKSIKDFSHCEESKTDDAANSHPSVLHLSLSAVRCTLYALFLFAFWLSLFSKDLATQSWLWLSLSFLLIKKK